MSTQSPTKYVPLTEPILTAAQLTQRMAAIQDVAIVLSPLTGVSDIPAGWRVSERYIFAQWEIVDYKGNKTPRGDVYRASWCQGDHVAPSGQLLNKIWSEAGGSILCLKRVDDRKNPHICETEGQLELRQLDSNLQRIPAERRLDLTEGSEAARGARSAAQLSQMRLRIHELSASEAFLRGIRKGLAMAQSYSMADLECKPFVVYACVPNFDMTDKMTRAMVVASQLGCVEALCVEALFGATGGGRQLLIEAAQAETIDTANGHTVDAKTGEVVDDFTPDPPPAEAPPEPTVPDAVCACEHGCQAPISKATVDSTTAYTGRPLCRSCYPFGEDFNVASHKGVTLKLEKNAKGWTAEKAAEYLAKKRGA